MPVNVRRMLLAHVSAVKGQEAAGRDDTGVGDEHHPASITNAQWRAHAGALPATHILLVNPLVETPTPAVFKARRGDFSAPARWDQPPATTRDLATYLTSRRNDLTDPAIIVAPVVADVLRAIGGTEECLLARLSGSGATCFGLYETAAAAEQARRQIVARHPTWWTVSAALAG